MLERFCSGGGQGKAPKPPPKIQGSLYRGEIEKARQHPPEPKKEIPKAGK